MLVGALLLAVGVNSAPAQNTSPKRVLVVSTTMGFRHSSIPTAEKIIGELAKQSGAFTVDYARIEPNDPQFKGADGKPDAAKVKAAMTEVLAEKMSVAALKNLDAVIFANTTGDLPLPDPQAFIDWIKSGKGFVGMHSATDTFPGFPPYIEMIGGEFKTHGAQVEVVAINQDAQCPACRHLPANWTVFDEIYQLKNFDRTKFMACSRSTNIRTTRPLAITPSRGARTSGKAGYSTPRSVTAKTSGTRSGRTARANARIRPPLPKLIKSTSSAASSGRSAWRRATRSHKPRSKRKALNGPEGPGQTRQKFSTLKLNL